ncbi:aldo/keto reductase [Pleomorphovibrio marinus]|uniref:aldo/keto reductase n=1 Tax=Pleomorphovibrio marinus TaxID=2164132 RepID=UPI001E41B9FF|nr:aldo/keto reductase [Pleomorphovibrio marinus]
MTTKPLTFANGDQMPAMGLGTWRSEPKEVFNAVIEAINYGYRHIDCAHIYQNEKEIGEALQKAFSDKLVKREDLWITSKLWNDSHLSHDVHPALKNTLSNLQIKYLDLYLIHWPVAIKKGIDFPSTSGDFLSYQEAPLPETWEAMESLHELGLVRHIGVSNFNRNKLKEILASCKIPPEVNQVELHPYLPQHKLKEFCDQNSIFLTAYGPLGAAYRVDNKEVDLPILLEDKTLKEIANSHNATAAQVALSWGMRRGTSVIPKSVHPKRIQENFDALKIQLSENQMKVMDQLEGPHRYTPGPAWVIEGSPYKLSDLWDEHS